MRRLEDTHISVPQGVSYDQPPLNDQPTHRQSFESSYLDEAPDSDAYPAHIFETAIRCRSRSVADRGALYQLWRQILAYWFPRSAGFAIEEDWRPALGVEQERHVNLAVLYRGQPLVLLYLDRDGLPEELLLEAANREFDRISVWSGQPALCVIVAVDMKWSTFIRPTDVTSGMVAESVGDDWCGGFEDEVWSLASYQNLKRYFDVLKASCI